VLKSPTHAFRIPLLQARFPEAVFIHLRRDPLEVFLSTRHTWRANARIYALHRPSAERDLDPLILACHRLHRQRMAEARERLGPRWVELDYPDLVRDPVGALAAIYHRFGWPGFEAVAPALAAYQAAHADYRTNGFRAADEAEAKRLLEALA
jgi:LPS sulfotransferase NodH